MARRAFMPTLLPPADALPQRSAAPPPMESRAPGPVQGDGIAPSAVAALLDRLGSTDDAPFLVRWIEGALAGRQRPDPALVTRLLRLYRETGQLDRARQLSASLAPQPGGWPSLELARLAIERAFHATGSGRYDHAESELRTASHALSSLGRNAAPREQVDVHVATAQLEHRRGRAEAAFAALKLAEHVEPRVEESASRASSAIALGHLAMRLAEPRIAVRHYLAAVERVPPTALTAMRARGNLAIALASVGAYDDARQHASAACQIAAERASGARQADALDVLAIVEIAADEPFAALQALDDAQNSVGESGSASLRAELAYHRALALAMMGKAPAAEQWVARGDALAAEVGGAREPIDEQDALATRVRVLEAAGLHAEAAELAAPHAERLPEAFATGTLNLALARCALAVGDEATAWAAAERAALSGDKRGWVFPDRFESSLLWSQLLRSGDSRVVRFAEKMMAFLSGQAPPPSIPPPRASIPPSLFPPSMPSVGPPSIPAPRASIPSPASIRPSSPTIPPEGSSDALLPDGEALLYVTTPEGVARVRSTELEDTLAACDTVVDTIAHSLRVGSKTTSLERRRALEPLVVQLFRRAREGLSAEEILRAAGGPGPDSADAEHRVRVLISRVRDLLGDASTIERVRDAGEHGKTRYRLAPGLRFALVEPLFVA